MADITVIKYDRNGDPNQGLHNWGAYPPENAASGEPLQKGHTNLDTASSIFSSGVWDCSPMKRVATTIERSELMYILEGSGSITNADGVAFNFRAGDTFIVPVGLGYQWQNDTYVKKIFCSYRP